MPRSIDYHRLEEDKRSQIRLESLISAALNAGRPAEVTLDQELINRWIAARHELWPGEVPSLGFFSRPAIVLEEGNRIRAAATVEYAGVHSVLSGSIQIELDGGVLRITPEEVRIGVLPAPTSFMEDALRSLIEESDSAILKVVDHHVETRNEWVWPNGKRLFRIAELSISDGKVRAVLESLE